MAAIDFPNSPTVGDIFTAGNSSYRWTGDAWVSYNLGSIDWYYVTNKPTEFPPSAHVHDIEDVTGLQDALDDKSDVGHTHVKTDITDFAHTHLLADITDYVEPDPLPSQTGNAGKYLTTDGSVTSWGTVDLSTKQDVVAGVSSTEIGYLDGVTSSIQTQLNDKLSATKVIEDKAASYTITATDSAKILRSTGSSATTFTIADVLQVGQSVEFIQSGSGLLTFEAAVGVTLNSYGLRSISLGRNSRFVVTKTQSGTYTLSGDLAPVLLTTDYLVVAGGGGGGTSRAAGGGAGGYREGIAVLQPDTDYQVFVGAGGATSPSSTASGNASMFDTITSAGGGYGGGGTSPTTGVGAPGGSGGGGAYGAAAGAGNTPAVAPSQGNPGASTGGETGGGGGGASAGGSGQTGGAGRSSSITGTAVFRGGGGGGGGWPSSGPGGVGGGGAGTSGSGSNGTPGTANTGGGGGGMSAWASQPGAGGSGVVILSYPSVYNITLSAGLTGSTATVASKKVTTITAGTGTVRFSL